jgi:hypothetical protein
MLVESRVAVWAWRAVVMLPADDQVPLPLDGLNSRVVLSVVVPFFPPVTRTLPFGRTVAV